MVAKQSCLILESNSIRASRLTALCNSLGLQVSLRRRRTAVQQMLADAPPDIFILPIADSEHDNLALLKHPGLSHAEVLVIVGLEDRRGAQQALALGAGCCFFEPLDEACMKTIISEVIADMPVPRNRQATELRRVAGDKTTELAEYFLHALNQRHRTTLSFAPSALQALAQNDELYELRSLRSTVERAYIFSEFVIDSGVLCDSVAAQKKSGIEEQTIRLSLDNSWAESEQQIILATLQKNNGDKKKTAQELNISLKTIYNRLHDYDERSAPVAIATV